MLPETAGAVINRKDNEWSAMSSNHVVKAARISGQVTNDTERPGARVKDSLLRLQARDCTTRRVGKSETATPL